MGIDCANSNAQAAEKLAPRAVLKGHELTRADKPIGFTPALAAEGCISQFFSELLIVFMQPAPIRNARVSP